MLNLNNTQRQNPPFPDNPSRFSEYNGRDDDGQEQVSGPGHAQPSPDVHALGSSVQSPSIGEEDTRIRHEEDNIAGPSGARGSIERFDQHLRRQASLLRARFINDGLCKSPLFDPTVPDPYPEAESLTLTTPTRSSQPPTQSSPSNPNQSRNSTLEMIHPDDTARQSLTPSSYYSEPREPGEPYSLTTSPMSRFQSASIRDPDHVSSPAPYWTRSADTDHGISPEELAIQDQNARVRARRANRGLANSSI
ncbi:hypothetical protein JMJ35_006643 [Cladonia borealis]|uniref:Uncharacterized protein n=1 Tax=Cladonia borealis TaxID=184061 RepID=A0AA39U972_9LECA|nr:hypothetical protein JMJ35_006643 [Cladonia borealis]